MKQNISILCDDDITKDLQLSRNSIPCAKCGSEERRLGAGKGLHTASLRCGGCESVALLRSADGFIRWVVKSELAKFKNQGGQI